MEVRAADNAVIVLDAGTGARGLGATLKTEVDRSPVSLFLTHQHLDHVIGLAPFASLVAPHRTVTMRCGNADLAETRGLADLMLSPPLYPAIDGVLEALVIEDFDATVPIPVGDSCLVYRFEANHPGGAAVLRLGDSRGMAIAFAPDNELAYASTDRKVIEWRTALAAQLRHVPILIHDAMFSEEELPQHVGWGHSSPQEATRFALECDAEMLVLCHHHPDRHDESIDSTVEACRALVAEKDGHVRVLAAWEGLNLYL